MYGAAVLRSAGARRSCVRVWVCCNWSTFYSATLEHAQCESARTVRGAQTVHGCTDTAGAQTVLAYTVSAYSPGAQYPPVRYSAVHPVQCQPYNAASSAVRASSVQCVLLQELTVSVSAQCRTVQCHRLVQTLAVSASVPRSGDGVLVRVVGKCGSSGQLRENIRGDSLQDVPVTCQSEHFASQVKFCNSPRG